jgi:uncharacterized membrane protein
MEAGAGTVISVALVLGAFVVKVTDLVKYIAALTKRSQASKDEGRNGLISLVLTAISGLIAIFVFKTTAWADEVSVGTETLADLNVLSTVILGLVAATVASTLYDFKKAVDGSETSSTPRITERAEQERIAQVDSHFRYPTRP